MYSKFIAMIFVVLYLILIWAVLTMRGSLAMDIMAFGMFADAVLTLLNFYKKR
ncbi:hypothetical protein Q757_00505 [Oenococcus alcoholitolerans]|uniref:DUF4305 domain-containing protein n=1 Tax=Oenococcus alcoholitolerans TaxID=931074 RepID=A0ABR4XTE7_9LACO|nr:hypothetical protein Q757_00505 [Oenococcus alcoholitolerans]